MGESDTGLRHESGVKPQPPQPRSLFPRKTSHSTAWFGIISPHSKSWAATTTRVPQGEDFDRATPNPIVKKVVNTTQMKPTYASCLRINSAGTNPWLRLKQFTRLLHLELHGAGCEGTIQLPPLRRPLNMALGATG